MVFRSISLYFGGRYQTSYFVHIFQFLTRSGRGWVLGRDRVKYLGNVCLHDEYQIITLFRTQELR